MDPNIKQRLVGIAVIFALAVIFLPMILDGSGVEKKSLRVEIPQQPQITSNPEFEKKIIELHAKVGELPKLQPRLIDEKSPQKTDQIKRQAKQKQPEKKPESSITKTTKAETKPKVKPVEKVVQKPAVGGDSWVLQVGSYKDRKKALTQRDQMRKSNIAAVFIEQFKNNSDLSYRVRLGPFLNRDQSKVAQNKIKAKYNIDGLIMKYER